MEAFRHNHYVPALTWKRGEQAALQAVPDAQRVQLTPLIQLVEIPIDLETGDQKKSLDEHLEPAVKKIESIWGTRHFFLDPREVANEINASGLDGAELSFQLANQLGISFVPVIGISRTQHELSAALKHQQHGICIRLTPDDLLKPTLQADILNFLGVINVAAAKIDLIIDLEAVATLPRLALFTSFKYYVSALPHINSWRTLTILASAFPSLGGLQGTSTHERKEWLAWQDLHNTRLQMPRMPTYGDYAIQSPDQMLDYDPRYMPMAPAIRYTLDDKWLIIRGISSKKVRIGAQYPHLAAQLVSDAQFYGVGHCRGCHDAAECASGKPGYGSGESWRRIGTVHHLMTVTAQLSSMPFP